MSNNLSSRQMINIELAARASNKKSTKLLKQHSPQAELDNLKILFNCECSNPDCKERIPLTLKEYELLHTKRARFVIKKGHDEPSVEKVKATGSGMAIVDKYAL